MTFTNWTIQIRTEDEQKCIPPLFEFVFQQFIEIFGAKLLENEPCIVYNRLKSHDPMLIISQSPIKIRTCSTLSSSLWGWAQYIYQISHELTHYIIRQYKEDKNSIIGWFEETLCEAMSLYILNTSSQRWKECTLSYINPNYEKIIISFFKEVYLKTGPSSLKKCRSIDDLIKIEKTCKTERISRSIERNYLFEVFCEYPEDISLFAHYPLYMQGDVQIDFKKWKADDSTPLIEKLESIQPKFIS